MPLPAGVRLGTYEILELIGMGEVYLRDTFVESRLASDLEPAMADLRVDLPIVEGRAQVHVLQGGT